MAPDLPPVKLAINELVRAGVHVVTLFSDVAGSMRETHIGADNRAAGRTAGLLLGAHGRRGSARHAAAVLAGDAPVGRDRAAHRLRAGDRRALPEAARCSARPTCRADDAGACARAAALLRRRTSTRRVAGIYNVGSGSAGVARALESAGPDRQRRRSSRTTSPTRTARCSAASGLAYVLHQDIHYCMLTAARVLRALCENVRGALNVVQPRIEILTAENLH